MAQLYWDTFTAQQWSGMTLDEWDTFLPYPPTGPAEHVPIFIRVFTPLAAGFNVERVQNANVATPTLNIGVFTGVESGAIYQGDNGGID